ncbi:MAG: dihydroorotate dehydrogenase electron transfer subunit [Oscillospiraceae bacterium]|nr:dihydroorotate dehydrogenase electron transfer subunit [Oscillospiraceae bacterium]
MPMTKDCIVLENYPLTAADYSMTVEAGELAQQARPGQFVHVKCGNGLLLRRPISICDVDTQHNTLLLVYQVKGEGTSWLAKLPKHHRVNLLGPLGHGFDIPKGKILVVGGGIGVPPMVYTARCADAAVAAVGFRSQAQVLLTGELEQCCEKVAVISDDGSTGRKGFVNVLVKELLAEDTSIAAVLACGPKVMLKTVADASREAGVPCQVSMEERMGCGVGACLVCACQIETPEGRQYHHVCQDGPVFRAEEVCWDAE